MALNALQVEGPEQFFQREAEKLLAEAGATEQLYNGSASDAEGDALGNAATSSEDGPAPLKAYPRMLSDDVTSKRAVLRQKIEEHYNSSIDSVIARAERVADGKKMGTNLQEIEEVISRAERIIEEEKRKKGGVTIDAPAPLSAWSPNDDNTDDEEEEQEKVPSSAPYSSWLDEVNKWTNRTLAKKEQEGEEKDDKEMDATIPSDQYGGWFGKLKEKATNKLISVGDSLKKKRVQEAAKKKAGSAYDEIQKKREEEDQALMGSPYKTKLPALVPLSAVTPAAGAVPALVPITNVLTNEERALADQLIGLAQRGGYYILHKDLESLYGKKDASDAHYSANLALAGALASLRSSMEKTLGAPLGALVGLQHAQAPLSERQATAFAATLEKYATTVHNSAGKTAGPSADEQHMALAASQRGAILGQHLQERLNTLGAKNDLKVSIAAMLGDLLNMSQNRLTRYSARVDTERRMNRLWTGTLNARMSSAQFALDHFM